MRRAERMLAWAVDMFGRIALDPHERALRFVEEALEVGHCLGLDRAEVDRTASRIWATPRVAMELGKEIGQAQMTLECLAEAAAMSSVEEGAREFARVRRVPRAEWRARHDRKVHAGFARWAPGDEPPQNKPPQGVEVDHIAAGNEVKTRPAGPGNCTLWPGCGCMTQSGPHACEGEVPR